MKRWQNYLLAAACGVAGLLMPDIASAQDPRTGIAAHWGKPENFDRCARMSAEAGVGWVRGGIGWKSVETEKGKYTMPAYMKPFMDACRKYNLKVVMLINHTTHTKGQEKSIGFYDDPYDPDAFAAYAAWVAKELPDVTHFEILNEPSNFGFSKNYGGTWNGTGDSPWVAKYVTLLNKSVEAIKAVRPDAKVGGLGSAPPVNFRQLAMGLSPKLDAITDHPYTYRLVPEQIPFAATPELIKRDGIATADAKGTLASQIRMYREQSAKFHGPKEIWYTEFGFASYQPNRPQMYAGVTQSAQAKYLQRRFIQCMGEGIEMTIWHNFQNNGRDPYDPEQNFGLVDPDFNPKPAFYALQRVNKIMPQWKPASWGNLKALTVGDRPDVWPIKWDGGTLAAPGEIVSYQYVNGQGQQALAVWSSERADGDLAPRLADLEISGVTSARKIEAIDMMTENRKELKFENKDDKIVIKRMTVPDSPVLLVFSGS